VVLIDITDAAEKEAVGTLRGAAEDSEFRVFGLTPAGRHNGGGRRTRPWMDAERIEYSELMGSSVRLLGSTTSCRPCSQKPATRAMTGRRKGFEARFSWP
jgi:hypothetical protein